MISCNVYFRYVFFFFVLRNSYLSFTCLFTSKTTCSQRAKVPSKLASVLHLLVWQSTVCQNEHLVCPSGNPGTTSLSCKRVLLIKGGRWMLGDPKGSQEIPREAKGSKGYFLSNFLLIVIRNNRLLHSLII